MKSKSQSTDTLFWTSVIHLEDLLIMASIIFPCGKIHETTLSHSGPISQCIFQLGPGCLLFERDLAQAFYQMPVDLFDYSLLGIRWRHNFILTSVCQWDSPV